MTRTIKSKTFKIVSVALALVLVLSAVTWNSLRASAMEITDVNQQGYTVVGGTGTVTGGKLVGTAENPAAIGVFVTGGTADKYNGKNIKWTNNGSVWSSDTKILFENNGNQKISAYYPYIDKYSDSTVTYNLRAVQTADTMKEDDLLYADEVALSAAKTSLNFAHKMTKLTVNITKLGTEIDTDLTIAKVEILGLATTAEFNPQTGELTAGTDLTGSTQAYKSAERVYDALVFPSTEYTTLTILVTMSDNSTYKTTVTCPAANTESGFEGGLAGGYQYTIQFQLGQDAVSLSGITADNWTSVNGGSLGTN